MNEKIQNFINILKKRNLEVREFVDIYYVSYNSEDIFYFSFDNINNVFENIVFFNDRCFSKNIEYLREGLRITKDIQDNLYIKDELKNILNFIFKDSFFGSFIDKEVKVDSVQYNSLLRFNMKSTLNLNNSFNFVLISNSFDLNNNSDINTFSKLILCLDTHVYYSFSFDFEDGTFTYCLDDTRKVDPDKRIYKKESLIDFKCNFERLSILAIGNVIKNILVQNKYDLAEGTELKSKKDIYDFLTLLEIQNM